MATYTRPLSLVLTHVPSSMHSHDHAPSLSCFTPKPLFRTFCPYPLALKPRETRWVNMNLQKEAMTWPYHTILAVFSTGDGEAVENVEEKEGVDGGDGSIMDAVTTSKAKKGKSSLPTKKEGRRNLRYIDIRELREITKEYDLKTVISLLKKTANTKFGKIVEAYLRLNIYPKYDNQRLSATVRLPKWTGDTVKVAVLTKGEKLVEAKNAGADLVGGEDLIKQIEEGFREFDKLITSPYMMPKLASIEAILESRGLMPNLEAGTITDNFSQAIEELKQEKVKYKADKTGIVHIKFGKIHMPDEDLIENFIAVVESIEANKPSGVVGKYWISAHVSTSMGLSVKLNIRDMLNYKIPSKL